MVFIKATSIFMILLWVVFLRPEVVLASCTCGSYFSGHYTDYYYGFTITYPDGSVVAGDGVGDCPTDGKTCLDRCGGEGPCSTCCTNCCHGIPSSTSPIPPSPSTRTTRRPTTSRRTTTRRTTTRRPTTTRRRSTTSRAIS